MFRSKTLFIVGAGASAEAKLPTGAQLAKIIEGKLDIRPTSGHQQTTGDYQIVEAFRRHIYKQSSSQNINPLLQPSSLSDLKHRGGWSGIPTGIASV